jgi:hypothetical protein
MTHEAARLSWTRPPAGLPRLAGALLAGLAANPAATALAAPDTAPPGQVITGSCPLDVVLVFDISGSMEYFSICYDCWVRVESTDPDYPDNGYYNPIPATVITSTLCSATPLPYVDGTRRYMIAEAELASYNPPLWGTRYRQAGQGYWAIQRGSRNGDFNNRAGDTANQSANVCRPGTGVDCSVPGDPSDHLCDDDPVADVQVDCSGYISHRPYVTYSQPAPPAEQIGMFYYLDDVIDNHPAPPRIEYYFTPDWTGTTYVWIRAQGGGRYAFEPVYHDPFIENKSTIHWDVQSSTDGFNPETNSQAPGANTWRDNRADPSLWRWIRLGSASTTANETFRLALWAGSPGYDIDKIVVTNDSRADASSIPALTYDGGRGRPATPGSAGYQACDPCNPIYGLSVRPEGCTGYSPVLTPTNNLANPLFGEVEPLRTSKEAAKRFIQRLDPRFDQAGFVPFTTNVTRADQAQLDCLRREGQSCYQGSSPISYTRVLMGVERPPAQFSTNIAEGMRNGLEVLGVNVRNLLDCLEGRDPYTNNCFDNTCDRADRHDSCGRGPAAQPVMVVLTDGSPNNNPGGCGNDPVYNFPYENDDDYDCVIYYAGKAREAGVLVHTVGLGGGARGDLLGMAAEVGGGRHYFAATPDELDEIFEVLISESRASCTLHGVQVAPPRQGSGLPGEAVSYTHTVTNLAVNSGPEVFSLTAVSALWAPAWQPATLALDAGQAAPVTVRLAIPTDAISGTQDILTLTVSSQANPAEVFDVVTDTTTVDYRPGASLAPPRQGSGRPGETRVYRHTLANTGNYTETFRLAAASSRGWPAVVAPVQLSLAAGRAAPVTVSVTLAEAGATDVTTVTAAHREGEAWLPAAVVTDTSRALPPERLYLPVVYRQS